MATDEVREGLQLVADGLEGLEAGRPLNDQQHWLLLKAFKCLQDADRAMRVKCPKWVWRFRHLAAVSVLLRGSVSSPD